MICTIQRKIGVYCTETLSSLSLLTCTRFVLCVDRAHLARRHCFYGDRDDDDDLMIMYAP